MELKYQNHWLIPFIWLIILALPSGAPAASPPDVMLAKVYQPGIDLNHYWVSEKLDGVRAFWDGRQLRSRQGNVYNAPAWFTAGFPSRQLDGELWLSRGSFEQLVSTVRKEHPDPDEWHRVRYWVFDLPDSDADFSKRLVMLEQLIKNLQTPYIKLVPQFRLPDHNALMQRLKEVVTAGGEGLMLHRDDSRYRSGRSEDLLKVKSYQDAEAVVIAHLPGKGKYHGMLGSLLVETADGIRFRLGTGFSDAQRNAPPAIGSLVTFKYFGKTKNGVPRFASFRRVRRDY